MSSPYYSTGTNCWSRAPYARLFFILLLAAWQVFLCDKARLVKLSVVLRFYLPARPAETDQQILVWRISARWGSVRFIHLHWLRLALYPVLVLAASFSGCGAVFSVPAPIPLLVFFASERIDRKKNQSFRLRFTDSVRTLLGISEQFGGMSWHGFTFSVRVIWLSSEGSWTDLYSSSCGPWLQHIYCIIAHYCIQYKLEALKNQIITR